MKPATPQAPIVLTNAARRALATHYGAEQAEQFITRFTLKQQPGAKASELTAVISDLHVGLGRDAIDGQADASDDFGSQQDHQFKGLFENVMRAAETGELHKLDFDLKGAKVRDSLSVRFIINGDFTDPLKMADRTSERPGFAPPDGYDKKGAMKNTPANHIVMLNAMVEGHPHVFQTMAKALLDGASIDILQGNHDYALSNPHVWQGEVTGRGGKTYVGLVPLLAREMAKMNASKPDIDEAVQRLSYMPLLMENGALTEHGNNADSSNRVQRPMKEWVDPTPLHEEMQMCLGDYVVRNGLNKVQQHEPLFDKIENKWDFVKFALHRPLQALQLARGFLSGLDEQGAEVSPEADLAHRLADIEALIRTNDKVYARYSDGGTNSREQVIAALQGMEKVSAVPLFSRFKKKTSVFTRLYTFVMQSVVGTADKRTTKEIMRDRAMEAQKHFPEIDTVVWGHTHKADQTTYLNPETGQVLHSMNEHTWLDQAGQQNNRQGLIMEEDGRGVAVGLSGVNPDGTPFHRRVFQQIVDPQGSTQQVTLLRDAEEDAEKAAAAARVIAERNPITGES